MPDAGSLAHLVLRLGNAHEVHSLADGELVERFARHADQEAFAELVRRHAGTVWRVCRCALPDRHDAEDACQATFLVLVRRAGALGRPHLVGNWLYGVAARVAAHARRVAARRTARERPLAADVAAPAGGGGEDGHDALYEELGRLPANYRLPLLLCYLDGQTNEEAARRLGWPVGTLKVRLMRAKAALRGRLVRRGAGLAAGGLPAAAGVVAPPAALADTTASAALAGSSGPPAATALAHGVLRTMRNAKLSFLAVTGFGTAAALAAGGWFSAPAARPAAPPIAGVTPVRPVAAAPAGVKAPPPGTTPPPADPGEAKAPPADPGEAKAPPADRPAPGGDAPITPERFARTHLGAVDGSHRWFFKGSRFVLAADAGAIPPALLAALLGPDRKADRVAGEWALNADRTRMTFTAVVAGGKPGVKAADLGVTPAGRMRVNVEGGGQYNATRFEATLPRPKGVAFPEYEYATKIDAAMLRGTWTVESRESAGVKADAADLEGTTVAVSGDAITVTTKGGVSHGTVRLDAVPTPATLDVTFTDGPEKGNSYLGVYDLDGDRWRFCRAAKAAGRPAAVETRPGRADVLDVLRRLPETDDTAADKRKESPGR